MTPARAIPTLRLHALPKNRAFWDSEEPEVCGLLLERTRALAAIQHPALHMPTVLEVDGRPVRVDAAPEWLSVREAVELGIRLTRHHGALLECDLVSAIRRLHNHGLIHGNVNEETVYIREDGRRVVLSCPAPLLEAPWTAEWHNDLSGVRDVVSLLETSSWWRGRKAR